MAPVPVYVSYLVVVFACLSQNADGSTVFDPEFEKTIDSFVKTTMECRRVPGLILAVVKDNDTWTKGYGQADIAASKSVTGHTLFQIASVSKSFTMALLRILLTEKNLKWSTKVRDILGTEYKFIDEYRTNEMTVRDLLVHRTGLAGLLLGLFAGIPKEVTRERFSKAMQHVPESRPFRDSFLYNNLMYAYLGHICEVLGGDTWENLLQDRILTPLGMTSTKIMKTPDDVQTGNVAKPYIYKDGRFENGTRNIYILHPQEPAGGILSTGEDMIKWMKFLVNKGKLENGTELIPERNIESAFKARITITSSSFLKTEFMTKPTWPIQMTAIGYGYGFDVASYRGYKKVHHSGRFHSYITRMFLYPDKKTGVFVSVNGPGFKRLPTYTTKAVSYYISDGVLGLEPWLNKTTTCSFPEPWLVEDKQPSTSNQTTYKTTDANDYCGLYEHSFLPGINIFLDKVDETVLRFEMNLISGILHATEDKEKFGMETLAPWEMMIAYTDQNNKTRTKEVEFIRETGHVTKLLLKDGVWVTFTKASQNSGHRSPSVSWYLLLIALVSYCYS